MSKTMDRLVILGLDGMSWPLLTALGGEGLLPHLEALLAESTAGPMTSTWPEISPVAWTTFYTGRSPGEHGIYGFTDFLPGEYRVGFNSSAQIRVPCVWDWLGLRGGRSVVLNVPLTYPARPLSGVMVSGFVALDYARAGYPSWVVDYLRGTGYRLEADFDRVQRDRAAFLVDLDRALAGRSALLERFWPETWDLFTLVVTDTDRLLHFFYREFLEDGPISDYFRSFFQRVDTLVGRVVELCREMASSGREVALVLLSDHGFAPVREEFHLNSWLAAHGFQTVVGPEALALALDPTRIYLNRPARFPGGRVRPGEEAALARAIGQGLRAESAVREVWAGADLYQGPEAARAPDLVVWPAPGYEFKAKFRPGPIHTPSPLMGTHTFSDAFYLVKDFTGRLPGPRVESILDLGRYVFSLLDW